MWILCAAVVLLFCPVTLGITDSVDVAALKILFLSLKFESADLEDPCGSGLSVVKCNNGKIIEIRFSGHILNGELGNNLNEFLSITTIDLKNNSIYGKIPSKLPLTLQHLDLSDNHLDGVIPRNLVSATQLQTLSLSRNQLQGSIPDSFHSLSQLTDLYLSNNNLGGVLPRSMALITPLTTLHLQNNMLSGNLNVLQGLRLNDLNIENNLFTGSIPSSFFCIPLFNYSGNSIPKRPTSSPTGCPMTPPVVSKAPLQGPPRSPPAPIEGTPSPAPKPVDVTFDVGGRPPPPGLISLASVSAPPPWSLPLIKGVSLPPKDVLIGVAVGAIFLVLICVALMARRGDRK